MASGSAQVIARSLPASLERVALFLTESGHDPDQAVAMAVNLLGATVKPSSEVRRVTNRWRHLRMTPHEREEFAHAVQTRRVLAEGMLLSLDGADVRDGAVLSAHALCEAVQARRPLGITLGGSRASLEQVKAARTRLLREVSLLDEVAEAAVGDEDLSMDDRTAKANPRVVHLQNRLNSLGYRVQPDGVFGPVTQENVKDVQAKAGLEPSGTVDALTRDVLRHGGTPSWAINAPPGTLPGMAPPPLDPAAADQADVNRETQNPASQAAPNGQQPAESSSDGGKGSTVKKADGKNTTITVKLKEAAATLRERLEEARAQRQAAAAAGDGMGVRVAEARMRVFERHVAELEERDFSEGRREALAKKGQALREGGRVVFPIESTEDLKNAVGLWKSGHHQTAAAKAHIQGQAKRLGAPDPFAEMQEADAKADYPAMQMGRACPMCGAPVRDGMCQRGHNVKKLAEATVEQLVADGVLQEDWATWDAKHKGQRPKFKAIPGADAHEVHVGGHHLGKVMRTGDFSGWVARSKDGGKIGPAGGGEFVHPTRAEAAQALVERAGGRFGTAPQQDAGKFSEAELVANYRKMFGKDPSKAQVGKLKKPVADWQKKAAVGMNTLTALQHADTDLAEDWATWDAGRDQHGGHLLAHVRSMAPGEQIRGQGGYIRRLPRPDIAGNHFETGTPGIDAQRHASPEHAIEDAVGRQGMRFPSVSGPTGMSSMARSSLSSRQRYPMQMARVEESKETAALSVTHAPIGKGGTNWITRSKPGNTGQIPAYMQNVRNAIMRSGKPESEATAIAVGRVEDWAEGKGGVTAEVKAAAAKAVAEWQAMRGKAHAKSAAKDAGKRAS